MQALSGTWASYATSLEDRVGHTSWVSTAELVLMGGWESRRTTETVNGGIDFTLVKNSV